MNLVSIGHVKKGNARGFTLIELLVVIAIIGILSAVVLASLSTARSKGKDAKIQEELSSMRAQAEIFYTVGNTYTGACSAGTNTIKTLVDAVTADSGATAECNVKNDGSAWAAEGKLTSAAGSYWCVDSTGASKAAGTALGAGTNC